MARTYTKSKTIEQRIWEKVNKTKTCWLWTASTKNGYGVIGDTGEILNRYAHRYSWELHNNKKIPNGLCALHRCDIRSCVNPKHLFLGTKKDNIHDCLKKGRFTIGEKHPSTSLTNEKVIAIRKNILNLTHHDLSIEYGVSRVTITNILNRNSWKHL